MKIDKYLGILLGVLAATHFIVIGLFGALFEVVRITVGINLVISLFLVIYMTCQHKIFGKGGDPISKDRGFAIWLYGFVLMLAYCWGAGWSLTDFQAKSLLET